MFLGNLIILLGLCDTRKNTTATSTSKTLSHSKTELTDMAEFEPQMDGKEDINNNLQGLVS